MKSSIIFIGLFVFRVVSSQVCFCEDGKGIPTNSTYFIVPTFIYSIDTGFGAGVAAFKSYNHSRARVSYVLFSSLYTVKKQLITVLRWDHYLSRNSDRISFEIEYTKFPTYFYGIGNSTPNDPEKFTPEYSIVNILYERELTRHFKVKTHFYMRNQSLIRSETGGILKMPLVPWHQGRLDAGPWIGFLWDSRDNIFATRRGTLAKLEYRGMMIHELFSILIRMWFWDI